MTVTVAPAMPATLSILTDQDTGEAGFPGRRATPLRVPASDTPAATASATSRLNTLGIT
jgi:hypothetical protein